ncbi:thymidine kinase [Cumulibacter manganitolerans]|uniref:thymidine kinase n=1 Tax=Cumulibacter manganitolerans TaxID=1884992 RepID=UPI001297C4F3|nr:thymidine kinase [Cumulibacter manganitolerans]
MTAASSALSSVPAAGGRRSASRTAELKYFYGPMDCGKSTLALQINHNHARQGRKGLLLTQKDRSGAPAITSRMGLADEAIEVADELDLRRVVRDRWSAGERVDYLIVDEAQFLSSEQVDQLAELVDESDVDVYAFGLATDFRSRMFPGSQRLFELADVVTPLQVEVLCWCGRAGRYNGRVVDGELVKHGEQVLVADTRSSEPVQVRYQVLCRRHWRHGDIGEDAGRQDPLPLG